MTDPVATANLSYTLTSTSQLLGRSASDRPRQGRLEITATRNPDAPGPTGCRAITLTLPTGTGRAALTDQPERIDSSYRATGSWYLLKNTADPERISFTFRPSNPRHEAVFDDGDAFVVTLDNIPLTAAPGDYTLTVTDESSTGTTAFAVGSAALALTVHPAPDPAG
jgi:hypothetical protein